MRRNCETVILKFKDELEKRARERQSTSTGGKSPQLIPQVGKAGFWINYMDEKHKSMVPFEEPLKLVFGLTILMRNSWQIKKSVPTYTPLLLTWPVFGVLPAAILKRGES